MFSMESGLAHVLAASAAVLSYSRRHHSAASS
jgi:hypothetical protein